jgi:hypothetical protein
VLLIRLSLFVGIAVSCGACSSWDPPPPVQAPATAAENPAVLLGAMSARQLVDALPGAGVPTLHPVDDTGAQCPGVGCDQSIVTDAFRVMSFPSTGAAERYAADHEARQVETLAVSFSPNVPAAERDRDWNAITGLVR